MLELYQASPWLRCEKHCFPWGKCTFLRNASMPRCSCAKPAFIKNRCRFGSLLELQSGLEMALAGNRQWNGSINRFWNAFWSHFAPHLGPIGLHVGFGWASLGPILATPEPHWPPFDPNFDPIGPMSASRTPHSGPFELHSCPRGPFEHHLSSISDPCWLHLDHICIPFDTDRQTRSHTDRPTSWKGHGKRGG